MSARRGGDKLAWRRKSTRDLKAMILGALDDAGGQQYLAEQARSNPAAFMTLLGKVLPLQVGGDPNGTPISVGLTIEQQREQARREISEAFAEYPREE
jgi:hypothetical protein